jgi:Family of unknown function (DUF6355)
MKRNATERNHVVNRAFLIRVLGVLAVVLGLTLTAMTSSASAQVLGGVDPAASAQAADEAKPEPAGPSGVIIDQQGSPARNVVGQPGGVGTQQTERCGYWLQYDSYYTHCGSYSIVIHVDFAWTQDRQITVYPGRTNLSRHWALKDQGGWIYDAYCIRYC